MKPDSSASSDGSPMPPRHRPALGNLAQDTTEADLWDLEEDSEKGQGDAGNPSTGTGSAQNEPRPKSVNRDVPAPRERPERKTSVSDDSSEPKPKPPAGDAVRMNIVNPRGRDTRVSNVSSVSKTESDFDDLEIWDDVPDEAESVPEETFEELPEIKPVTEAPPVEPPALETVPEPAPSVKTDANPRSDDEFSPVVSPNAKPLSLKPNLKLSGIERIGLLALTVILLGFVVAVTTYSLHQLPTEPSKTRESDFPVKGAHLTIESATSYWREPMMEGPQLDTFRRGTLLLPELVMKVSGGPAAIRVLFRDDEHTVMGDAVTRTITETGVVKIPATAGFDDLGMHAAYRTGNGKPWTIEVFEAPADTTVGSEFKKVFEMNISAARR